MKIKLELSAEAFMSKNCIDESETNSVPLAIAVGKARGGGSERNPPTN